MAALASYVVSHLIGEAESLENIAQISGIHADHLFLSYQSVYADRNRVIPENLLKQLISRNEDRFLACLPTPFVGEESEEIEMADLHQIMSIDTAPELSAGNDDMDMEAEGIVEIIYPSNSYSDSDSERLEFFSHELCMEFGYNHYTYDIFLISKRIRNSITQQNDPRALAAVSIFVASHLFDDPWSMKHLSQVIEVNEISMRSIYTLIYPDRYDLIGSLILQKIGLRDPQRALKAIAPLDWPEF